ncbi:MAG: putative ABC exporter domain-containing protein [Isosphaeraceae bacterium]
MDRSLWLLLRLRGIALARHWGKNLRSLKGLLLGVVGALLFLPLLLSPFFARGIRTEEQIEAIRHYGAFAFFLFCLMQVLLSAGERAIYYSPAEINFLFSGPYPPRQLLLYKIAASVPAAAILAGFMTLGSAAHSAWLLAAFLGIFLAILLLFLFTLFMGMLMSMLGTLAFDRIRQLVLAGVGVGLLIAFAPIGRNVQTQGVRQSIDQFLTTPVAHVVLLPFRPFVMTFTAERLWPDLIVWSLVSLAVNAVALVLVLALNAQFLETSINVSAKIYSRIQRYKRGENVVLTPARTHLEIRMLPWWGGMGPNLWRQVVTFTRSGQKLFSLVMLFTLPMLSTFLAPRPNGSTVALLAPALSMLVGVGLMAPSLIGFDFRSDLARMEDLKTLPIRPSALVVGEIVTPVFILSVFEWLALGFVAWLVQAQGWAFGLAATLIPPINFLLVAIDNLYFLWFPFRLTGFNPFDVQAIGRHTLLVMAKMMTLSVVLAIAGGLGAVPYYLLGGNWTVAAATAWVVITAVGFSLIPLLAQAFVAFDVTEVASE